MEPYLAQITMFAANFAPRAWSLCDGQLLPISQNSALFSLLGTTYGGDGEETFALPDLRGRFPMHPGHGPGLTNRALGTRSGTETNTLNTTQLPPHGHGLQPPTVPVSNNVGDQTTPDGNVLARANDGESNFTTDANPAGSMATAGGSVGSTGNGASVNNMPPFLCVNFIIALQGLYPSES